MTSKSRSERKIRLSIVAPDKATEIFLVDDRFERLQSAVGTLERKVSPGLYKVRFRSGTTQEDRLVEVPATTRSKIEFRGEPLVFESTTPLLDTRADDERYYRLAGEESARTHVRAGKGSGIFLFVRHPHPDTGRHPGAGVTLHSIEGQNIADMEADGIYRPEASCCCMNVELAPGTYRLRVATERLGAVEMFVVACKGWQTMLFGLTSKSANGKEKHCASKRLLLKSVAAHMTKPGKAFDPASPSFRLAELARIALETRRTVVDPATFPRVFASARDNPLFGLYGAHLLLLERRPDFRVIDTIAEKLERLIGPHPDVHALLLAGSNERKRKHPVSFPAPPMLMRSWDLITRRSLRKSSIVPAGSFSDRFSNSLLTTPPWLLHRLTESGEKQKTGPSLAKTEEMFDYLAGVSATDKGFSLLDTALNQRKDLTQLERNIVQTLLEQARQSIPHKQKQEPPSFSLRELVTNVKVPTVSLKRTARSLFDKLDLPDTR